MHTEAYSGTVTKSAEVTTNDPQRPHFTLLLSMTISENNTIAGKPVGPFIVSPIDRWVTHITHGTETGGLITIHNTTAEPLHITKVEPGGTTFAVKLQAVEEGKRYAVNFAPPKTLAVGSYKQTVKLLTDSKETPVIPLQLELHVRALVTVNPAKLWFENLVVSGPDIEAAHLMSKFLQVSLWRGDGLKLIKFSSTLPFIQVKVENGGEQGYLLRVGFSAKPAKGEHEGVLKIETNNAEVPLLEIPIKVSAK